MYVRKILPLYPLIYMVFPCAPGPKCVHRILPHLEVEKTLKNLGFFSLRLQGEYTYTTPSESREYGLERREKRVKKNAFCSGR